MVGEFVRHHSRTNLSLNLSPVGTFADLPEMQFFLRNETKGLGAQISTSKGPAATPPKFQKEFLESLV